MFSQACIIPSVHGVGVYAWQEGVCDGAWYGWGRMGHVWASEGRDMRDRREKATAADGTHPTGMHSCYFMHG